MNRFKFFKQKAKNDCGPACLKMITDYHGGKIDYRTILKKFTLTEEGASLQELSKTSQNLGFKSLKGKSNFKNLKKIKTPYIVHWKGKHYVVVFKMSSNYVQIADPAIGKIKITHEEFIKSWVVDNTSLSSQGYVLILEPTPRFNSKDRENNFSFLRELLSFLKPHKKVFFQIILALFTGSIIQLFLPILSQLFIDKGLNLSNKNLIFLILIGQIILSLGGIATNFLRSMISLHLGTVVNISIVSDFIMRILKMPLAYFENKNAGDLLQRIRDNNRIEKFLTESVINVMFSILNLIIFGSILALYSLKIFGIFCIGSILYLIWIISFLPWRKRVEKRLFSLSSSNTDVLLELFNGVSDLKFFNIENEKRWEWEKEQAALYFAKRRMLVVNHIQNAGSSFVNTIKNFMIIYFAAISVVEGQISLGMFFAVQFILAQANAPIMAIMSFIRNFQFAKISFDRLKEINDEINKIPKDITSYKKPTQYNISFSNVTFSYPINKRGFNIENVSIQIPENKTTIIVGESGSGKTTILKLILKFYEAEKGNIEIGNINLDTIDADWWYEKSGMVLQDNYVFSDTIANNITMTSENIDVENLKKSIEMANIESFISSLPLGLETKLGKGGQRLSQGQRQRMFLARLFYKNPKFVFLDEATNSLDSENETIIINNLKKFLVHKTAIIIDHKLSSTLNADKIIVVENGKVIEEGTHSELLESKSRYHGLLQKQKKLHGIKSNEK